MKPNWDQQRLLEMAEAAIEGQLSVDQLAQLDAWVTSDADACRLYADYVSLHASLYVTAGHSVLPCSADAIRERSVVDSPAIRPDSRSPRWRRRSFRVLVFSILMALGVGFGLASLQNPRSLATLTEAPNCHWSAGTLPTEIGAQLPAGRLRLAEGLARISFHNGVDVRIESPADLELVSPLKCILRSGKLVAHVPPGAQGFVVETPTSVVTDFGTEFGVSVDHDESAIVQVFDGRVETEHRGTGRSTSMQKGAVYFFRRSDFGALENAEWSSMSKGPLSNQDIADTSARSVQITTAFGEGRDAFVQPEEIPDKDKALGLLLVKRPIPTEANFERWAYLKFDLRDLPVESVSEAELRITFAPTGLGFVSLVPDAQFLVYGMQDERQDHWNEDTLNWQNAPGILSLGDQSKSACLIPLGSFVLAQGDQSSTVRVSGDTLRDFLRSDSNGVATLVIIRDTAGTGPSSLVHGFASRRHSFLPPPTLRLLLK